MVSKILRVAVVAGAAILLNACAQGASGPSEDYIIGSNIKDVTSLTSDQGVEVKKIALYDKTVDMIHQFNLDGLTLERSLEPGQKGGDHKLLYSPSGNYIIDLAGKYIGVYNKAGELTKQPFTFEGEPKSAAFHPDSGYLVIYDSVSSVGMMKLDSEGNIVSKWMGGPILGGGVGIKCGDIDDSGHLILGMSDNTIAIVDLAQTMANQAWTFTSFASTLNDIRWLAPVHGVAHQILTRSHEKVALIDTSAGTVLDSVDVDASGQKIKTSKAFDAHVMVIEAGGVDIYYSQGTTLGHTHSSVVPTSLLSSRLNLSEGTMTWVDSKYSWWYEVDQPNYYKESRQIIRFHLPDMLVQKRMSIPNEAELEITMNHIFELYDSRFGYAVYFGLNDNSKQELKLFNKPFIGRMK